MATWGGSLPAAGTEVVIPAGRTVVLDTTTASLGALRVEGTLRFGAADVALTAASIRVSGALLIGAAGAPYLNRATITLTGTPVSPNDGTARGLNIDGGRLEIYAASPQPIWTRIGDHAPAGASALSLSANVNWRSGDTIAVAPSDYYGTSVTERLVLASDAAGNRLATRSALATARWGRLQYITSAGMSLAPEAGYTPPVAPAPTVLDQRAAVANLSRNVVIQSIDDTHWRTSGFGAHVMVMGLQSRVVVDGVEFRRAGQAGVTGRYPFHWHMLSYSSTGALLGDASGHMIRNSAVWDSANRCIVVHGTNGVQVLNNVCQDIKGHAFFLEDAVERRNVFDGNIALLVRAPVPERRLQVHESELFQGGPAGFWLTNPDNVVRNNLAADTQGNGFWMAFPRMALGLSSRVAIIPDRTPHGVFEDNVAHSNRGPGVLMDWAPIDAAGNVNSNRYIPTVDGSEDRFTNQIRIALKRITSYKNLGGAYRNRVSQPDYSEWVTADNVGTHFAGQGDDGTITRSLLVGTSLNNPTPYPNVWPNEPPSAFATYHSTFSMRDNTLVNFPFVDGKSSGAFRTDDYYTAGIDKGPARNGNNRLLASHGGYRTLPPLLDGLPLNNRNHTYSGALLDAHGYWGPRGNYWVYDLPFLTAGANCTPVAPAGRNGMSCAGEYYGVEQFQTDFDNSRYNFVAPIDVVRQDGNGAEIGRWSVGDGALAPALGNMRHFAALPGSRYVLRFPGKPNPRWFAMTVTNAWRASDSMLMAVAFDGSVTASGYTIAGYVGSRDRTDVPNSMRNFTAAASLAEVSASAGNKLWQDRANNLVWIKFQGGIPYPNETTLTPNSNEALYKPFSVVLLGG